MPSSCEAGAGSDGAEMLRPPSFLELITYHNPTFSNGNLTPDQKRDIIAYINHLNDSAGVGGFGMGSLGPVAEGLFAWIVGIGGLVGFAVWIAAHTTRSSKKKVQA